MLQFKCYLNATILRLKATVTLSTSPYEYPLRFIYDYSKNNPDLFFGWDLFVLFYVVLNPYNNLCP